VSDCYINCIVSFQPFMVASTNNLILICFIATSVPLMSHIIKQDSLTLYLSVSLFLSLTGSCSVLVELRQVRPVSKSKLLGIVMAEICDL